MTKTADLKDEIEQLEKEIRTLRNATEGGLFWATLNWVSRHFIVGKNVSASSESLIRKYKLRPTAIHEAEIASLVDALVNRMVFVHILGILLALLPLLILCCQSCLLKSQTVIQTAQFAAFLAEKKLEGVNVMSCTLEDKDINVKSFDVLDGDGYDLRVDHIKTHGRKLKIIVANNTKLPVVLDELKLEIVEDGIRRFADPRTSGPQFTPESRNFLIPGEGGNGVARLDLLVQPFTAAVVEFHISMPLVEKGGSVNFHGEINYGNGSSKGDKLVFYQETLAEKELVIGPSQGKVVENKQFQSLLKRDRDYEEKKKEEGRSFSRRAQ